MDDKKPSTADIMAKIRAQKAAAAAASETPPSAVPSSGAAPAPAAAAEGSAAGAPVSATPKPAAPTAKPGSTKDILAAIRAKGGAAAAAPAAGGAPPAVEAAAVSATPPASPAVAAGPRPSVQDMLKAVREGKPVAAAPASGTKPTVAAPPAPAKPVSAAAKKAPAPQRRGLAAFVVVAGISLGCFIGSALTGSVLLFLAGMVVWSFVMSPFMAAWAALTEVTGLWTLHTARFMMPNVLVEPPSKFKVGPTSDYPLNTVSNKWKDQYGVWIVHTDQYEGQNLIFALASVCTHLGCTPSWLDGEQKFKCPCHGSGFYITGVNFEGPAPRPLERMGLKIAEGMLEVDKSMKFQEEMGQWVDPASFVSVS
jgi:cytochrome b6-f complex iron-sulfur subunit